MSVGVSEALDLALCALLDPGDEVIYHEPCYVSYSPSIALAHGVPVAVQTEGVDGFALRAGAVAAAITPRSKVLMLNFPTNPTGATMPRTELEKIAALCQRHNLVVLTDEIYSELTYDGGEHVSHRRAAGHEGTHGVPARVFQGVRHDGIPHRLRVRALGVDRGDDEDPPVRHPSARRSPARRRRSRRCATANPTWRTCGASTRRDATSSWARSTTSGCRATGRAGRSTCSADIRPSGLTSREFSLRLLKGKEGRGGAGDGVRRAGGEGFVRCAYATNLPKIKTALGLVGEFLREL